MKILFCKISNMRYYKGVCDADQPKFGGKYVEENGYGHEEINFMPLETDGEELECFGFVEPKSNRGTRNTLHIENIEGCEACKNEDCIEDVLVIWCAKQDRGNVSVVGWYKHATVWRNLQDWTFTDSEGVEHERVYNVIAKAKDCVLIPADRRNNNRWNVVTAKYTKSYGFGQSMVWYPTQPEAKVFLDRLVENIENYEEENWLDKFPY